MNLNEFVTNYTGTYVDKHGRTGGSVDNNGTNDYMGQCASLVVAYLNQVCSRPVQSYGNATDYQRLTNATKVNIPENGDLVIFPNISTPYGHIGIWFNSYIFNQNPWKARLDTDFKGNKVFIRPNDKPNNQNNPTTETKGHRKMECIICIDDDHFGLPKGTVCYYSPEAGVIPLPDPDCINILNHISQYWTGKNLPEIHSNSSNPWVTRLMQTSAPQGDYSSDKIYADSRRDSILNAIAGMSSKLDSIKNDNTIEVIKPVDKTQLLKELDELRQAVDAL